MHATRLEILKRQADAARLPFHTINIPDPCSDEQCDAIMKTFIEESRSKGIECMAFGDLFLQDVRNYREKQLHGSGIDPIFPLWKIPTKTLAEQMLASGVRRTSVAWIPRRCPPPLPDSCGLKHCSPNFRQTLIRAAKTESFTRLRSTGHSFVLPFVFRSERQSNGRGSFLQMSSQKTEKNVYRVKSAFILTFL